MAIIPHPQDQTVIGKRNISLQTGTGFFSLRPPEDAALGLLHQHYVKRSNESGRQVALAVDDSYKRLLAPSLENELRTTMKERADQEAIQVFAGNLRQLLLAPPMGQKRVLALDPGFRTGAKLVYLDGQGRLLHFTTIYPTHSERKSLEDVVVSCVNSVGVEVNSASMELPTFVSGLGPVLAKNQCD